MYFKRVFMLKVKLKEQCYTTSNHAEETDIYIYVYKIMTSA